MLLPNTLPPSSEVTSRPNVMVIIPMDGFVLLPYFHVFVKIHMCSDQIYLSTNMLQFNFMFTLHSSVASFLTSNSKTVLATLKGFHCHMKTDTENWARFCCRSFSANIQILHSV